MAVNIIVGNTFDVVAHRVYDEIKNNGLNNGRHILFVPDQYALMSEMEVLDWLGVRGSFNIEVYGFSRFAHKMLCDRTRVMLNQQTSVMLLEKIILDSRDDLVCYGKVAGKTGYVNEIYAVITSLRNSKVSPEQIEKASKSMRGNMAGKMRDISLLYRRYLSKLSEEYTDIGSELEALARAIPTLDYVQGAHIYVVDIYDTTRVKQDIIKALIGVSASFNIGVVDCPLAKNERIYPRYLIDMVSAVAQEQGLTAHRIDVSSALDAERSVVADRLFSYYQSTDIAPEGHYQVLSAEDKRQEVRGVAREIRRLVVTCGYRWRDVAIVADDIDSYGELIKHEFKSFDIPCYIDDKSPLINTAIARLYLLAVGVAERSYRRSEVLAFAHSELLNITADERNIFELYVYKYNVNYSHFTRPFELGIEDSMYDVAERVRGYIYSLVSVLDYAQADALQSVALIREFYSKSIADYAKYIEKVAENDSIAGEVARLAYDRIFTLLEQIEQILCAGVYTAMEMSEIVLAVFSSVQISTVPQYVDSVFVGEASKSKYSNVRVMFVLGANEGSYPTEGRGHGIIGEPEVQKLAECGVEIYPNAREKSLLDKFYIQQLLLKASDKVVVTFNRMAGEPSITVSQLVRMLNLRVGELIGDGNRAEMSATDFGAKIGARGNAMTELLQFYSEQMSGQRVTPPEFFDYLYTRLGEDFDSKLLNTHKATDSIRPHDIMWSKQGERTFASISKVESYFRCPFKFFCQYVLGLKENKSGEPNVADLGSFTHRVLEIFFDENKDFTMPEKELEAIIDDITSRVLEEADFVSYRDTMTVGAIEQTLYARNRYIVGRVVECVRNSDFNVEHTELKFGIGGSGLPPLKIEGEGQTYYMRGVIDRVDRYGDYVVLVDYKSKANIDFGLPEIYYGERVQLLLYINAYSAHNNCRPLALYYMPMPYGYKKDGESVGKYMYVGITRNLEDGIAHYDREYDNTQKRHIPVSIKRGKGGGLDESKLYSERDFDALRQYANDVILQAISEMESGYIAPRPLSCDYCQYGNICGVKNNGDYMRVKGKVSMYAQKEDSDGQDSLE